MGPLNGTHFMAVKGMAIINSGSMGSFTELGVGMIICNLKNDLLIMVLIKLVDLLLVTINNHV